MRYIKNYVKSIRLSLVIIGLILAIVLSYSRRSNNLEIYFLDVGQGDATYIKLPDGYDILVDGGRDNTVLEELTQIMPFFDRKIDMIILTHPDQDHLAGLNDVMNYYDYDYIITTEKTSESYEYEIFEDKIDKDKLLSYTEDIKLGCCVYLNFLWPDRNTNISNIDPNDTSITFELIYKNFNMYIAGDLSKEYEDKIFNEEPLLDIDVLKVSHHGSNTSTSKYFVQRINPEIAIISAGKNNSYGHPHREVINSLEEYGVEILRTDEIGTIKLVSNGEIYWLD